MVLDLEVYHLIKVAEVMVHEDRHMVMERVEELSIIQKVISSRAIIMMKNKKKKDTCTVRSPMTKVNHAPSSISRH